MVKEAKQFKAEDDAQSKRIAARNKLENYAFSVQNTFRDHGDKLQREDNEKVEREIKKVLNWLGSNGLADNHKFKKLKLKNYFFYYKLNSFRRFAHL